VTDLQKRVARAMAREFHGDEKDWREFQQEAKAVLAELGLTQAEPVAKLREALAEFDSEHGDPDAKALALLASVRELLNAAPQPQAHPLDVELAKLRIAVQAWENGVYARLAAPPRPQAEPVGAITRGHCENHKQPGGCPLHNLHCGWPKCDEREEKASG
jgi:hypothetical protein